MHPSAHQTPACWIGLAIAFYAFVAIGITEASFGILLPSVLVTYHLTPATITDLFISQISGYLLATIASSLISHRFGLARLLLFATSALILALLTYALSPQWIVMVAMGTLLGLGIGLIDAGLNTYIVQDEHSAHLIGLLHACYGIGAMVGPALATTLLALGCHWRQVYLGLAGVVGLLWLGVLVVLLCRYAPLTARVNRSGGKALGNLGRSLKHPVVLLLGLLLLIYVGTESTLSNWAYTVQTVARQTPTLLAGYSVSAYWLGLTLGRFGLSYLLRRFGGSRTIGLSLGLLLLGLLIWWHCSDPRLSLPFIGVAISAIYPAIIWIIPQRIPAALVPAAVSLVTSAASLGAALIPTASGWLASWVGLEIIPVILLPMAIAMLGLHAWLRRFPLPLPTATTHQTP